VIVNRKMAALLAESPAAEFDVPLEFRMFVAGGFKDVEGCVFFRELFSGHDHATALPQYGDATGYEASVNSQHVEDYLPPGTARTPVSLALIARSCARLLASRLRVYSSAPFRVIVTVNGHRSTNRFHTVRQDEPPWLEDLEGHDQAILMLDTTDVELDES
jgi:hypothetical protein